MENNNRIITSLSLIIVTLLAVVVYLFVRLVNTPQTQQTITNNSPLSNEKVVSGDTTNTPKATQLDSQYQQPTEQMTSGTQMLQLIQNDFSMESLTEPRHTLVHDLPIPAVAPGIIIASQAMTSSQADQIVAQIKRLFNLNGYSLQTQYVDTAGWDFVHEFYSNGQDVLLLSDYWAEGDTPDADNALYKVQVEYVATVEQLAQAEADMAIPRQAAKLANVPSNVIRQVQAVTVGGQERFVASGCFYNGDCYMVYYKVDGTQVIPLYADLEDAHTCYLIANKDASTALLTQADKDYLWEAASCDTNGWQRMKNLGELGSWMENWVK